MKKKLLLFGLLTISFVLAGCSEKNTNNANNNDTNSSDTSGSGEGQGGEGQGGEGEGGGETDPQKEYVTISIYEGPFATKTLVETQKIEKGSLLKASLAEPKKQGYSFVEFEYYSNQGVKIADKTFSTLKANTDMSVFAVFDKIDYNSVHNVERESSTLKGTEYINSGTQEQQANFYQAGYVEGKIPDFSQYKNTSAYVQVSNADQLIQALSQTKCNYTNNWEYKNLTSEQEEKIADYNYLMEKRAQGGDAALTSEEKTRRLALEKEIMLYEGTVSQELISDSDIHVIEITNDINLGYEKLSAASKALVTNWSSSKTGYSTTSHFLENGVSQINISNAHNLLIYSKNSAKITNAGFKINNSKGVVVRNLEMDEIWQWEDSPSDKPTFTVGDMDVFGWAYFKINFSTDVWIDHCTFGKSYDGQIDVANPYWYNIRTYSEAPYGVDSNDEKSRIHISNCKFQSGSDDPDGYLYKMMQEIEADYQKSLTDSTYQCQYLYYKTLRDRYNVSFEEILYGIAIPQKKAFLWGDSGESKKTESYRYNQNLYVSLANNIIVDIEDRLPNVRGGIAYMYNCLIDNSRYYKYRQLLSEKGAGNISSVNSYVNDKGKTVYPYKLALVSQGMIGGYGASLRAENCIFIGVNTLVKNNNSEKDDITTEQMAAGYSIINSIWYNDKDSEDVGRIINTDTNPSVISSTVGQTSPMSTTYFNWHNDDNQKPFNPALYDVNNLTSLLYESQAVGANSNYDDLYIYTSKN